MILLVSKLQTKKRGKCVLKENLRVNAKIDLFN